MKLKATLLALLALVALCGCQSENTTTANSGHETPGAVQSVDAVQLYKDSFENAKEMEAYNMSTSMTMGMPAMNVEMTIDMDSAVLDKGEIAVHNMSFTSAGATQNSVMYQKDGFVYSSIAGSDKFLKQSQEEGNSFNQQSFLTLGSGDMAEDYIDAIDSAETLTVTQEDGTVKVVFDFGKESLEAVSDEITSVLVESMTASLEEELTVQVESMGLSGDNLTAMVTQMMEVYTNMFSNVTVENIHMEKTMNKEGFCTAQNLSMSINMDLSQLLSNLGEAVDAETAEQLKAMSMDMKLESTYNNINGAVEVSIPEFTADNTLSAEEAAELMK